MFLARNLKNADIVFFIALGVIALICVAVYFLTPVIKRKQFEEQRANLEKREEIFKSNMAQRKENTQNENTNIKSEGNS